MLGETIETLVRHREQAISALSEYIADLEEEGEQEDSCTVAKELLAVQKELLEGLRTGGINATPTEWHMEQIVSALTYHVDYDFKLAHVEAGNRDSSFYNARHHELIRRIVFTRRSSSLDSAELATPVNSLGCRPTEVLGQAMALAIGPGAVKAMAAAAHKHPRDGQDSQEKVGPQQPNRQLTVQRTRKVVLVDNETGADHAPQRAEFDTSVCPP
ncbi:hypothetical protein CcaverHIS631_0104550 [Cutaneotrichosporon cavernicola]|nr:hypothetical protein CcaverHIS631_0104550 [Cutaneotrichosporon cavernicola]